MAKAAWTRALSEPEAERRPPLDHAAADPAPTPDRPRSVDDRPGASRPDEAYLADRAAAFRAAERRDRAASAYVPPLSLLEEPLPGLFGPPPPPDFPSPTRMLIEAIGPAQRRSLIEEPLPRPPYNLLTGRMSPEFRQEWEGYRERAEGGWGGESGKLRALARTAPPAMPRDDTDLPVGAPGLGAGLGETPDADDDAAKPIRYAEVNNPDPETGTDAERKSGASAETDDRRPPAFRRSIFKDNTWWRDFRAAAEDIPGITGAEIFALLEIYGVEGGNLKDTGSTASSGILQRTLDNVKRLGLTWGLDDVREPKDMTTEQRPRVLRAVLDTELRTVDPAYGRNGGSFLLDTVGNRYAAAALADTLIRHGGPDGATLIQKAINDVKPNSVTVDGALGSRTWAAYKALAQDPMRSSAWLIALASERRSVTDKREHARINHYEYRDQR